jgi:hypothetical protein
MSRSALNSLAATGAPAAVIAVGAVACGPAQDSDSPSDSKSTTTSAPAEQQDEKSSSKPETKAAAKGSGTFQVGSDIKPGTYLTTGNDDGLCYWERAKDA